MPQVKCKTCGKQEGKKEWFKSPQSIDKCEACKKAAADEAKELAVAVEKEKAASKEKELTIEKEIKEKELAIEKEKTALKDKELAIEKEKAAALKDKIAADERKQEYNKWNFEVQTKKDEESRQSNHEMKLKEIEKSSAAQKEEIQLKKEAQLEIVEHQGEKAAEVAKIFAQVELEKVKAIRESNDNRFQLVLKMIESGNVDYKTVQSLAPSTIQFNFTPVTESLSTIKKHVPDIIADDVNSRKAPVCENVVIRRFICRVPPTHSLDIWK